ncbi:hypothetical protein V6N13_113842 [Hibiscus sabdariffa]
MSPYPPQSSVEVLRTSNVRSPENLVPLVDPNLSDQILVVHDSQSIDRVLVLNGFQFPLLERSGSLLSADDLQTTKRGKVADSIVAMDMLKSMEIDDQPAFIPVNHGFPTMSECEKGNDVPPTASYAQIVSRSGTQVVSEPVPSLDDVVVESSDVMVDKTGLFPLDELRVELMPNASASSLKVSKNEVYGPWMLANTRCRQPHKDVGRSKGMASTGAGIGGSRFTVLSDAEGAVSILDVANEKRRQRLASNGGKKPIARKNSGAGLKTCLKVRKVNVATLGATVLNVSASNLVGQLMRHWLPQRCVWLVVVSKDQPQLEKFLRNTWDMTADVESNGIDRALRFLIQLDIDMRAELEELKNMDVRFYRYLFTSCGNIDLSSVVRGQFKQCTSDMRQVLLAPVLDEESTLLPKGVCLEVEKIIRNFLWGHMEGLSGFILSTGRESAP